MSKFSVKTGIDLVQISHLKSRLQRHPQALLARLFTERERSEMGLTLPVPSLGRLQDAFLQDVRQIARIAARYAAKEAFAKALGCGLWGERGLSLHAVEIYRQDGGQPAYRWEEAGLVPYLQGPSGCRRILASSLSLSHDGDYAVASCVLILADAEDEKGKAGAREVKAGEVKAGERKAGQEAGAERRRGKERLPGAREKVREAQIG